VPGTRNPSYRNPAARGASPGGGGNMCESDTAPARPGNELAMAPPGTDLLLVDGQPIRDETRRPGNGALFLVSFGLALTQFCPRPDRARFSIFLAPPRKQSD
jgi:hypothetical protein